MSDTIRIRGARVHNLKNIDLDLPRQRLIVITGLSGSGKSSLAFDTLYAEGQRRYVESLNVYARQFLDRMEKPDVDSIEGLSPAICIEQRGGSRTPRSTVGTVTETYDYLRVLFARIGKPHCPRCGNPIEAQSVDQMVDRIKGLGEGVRFILTAPLVRGRKGEHQALFQRLLRDGFTRVLVDGEMKQIEEGITLSRTRSHDIDVVVDRLTVRAGIESRLSESLETALKYGEGLARVLLSEGKEFLLSERHSCPRCEISLPDFDPRHFSFNAPQGACPRCNGLGVEKVFDPQKVIADPYAPLSAETFHPFRHRGKEYIAQILRGVADALGFHLNRSFHSLTPEQKKVILYGLSDPPLEIPITLQSRSGRHRYTFIKTFPGILGLLEERYRNTESPAVREELEQYMTETKCPDCNGARLKPEVLAVRIAGKNIAEVFAMSPRELLEWLDSLTLTPREQRIAERIFAELKERLHFLMDVGLDYLTLDRPAHTLSGGEEQRIRLATQLGNALCGVLYILDEPSVGLHPYDQERLLSTLFRLRDRGNTVIVVEHDENTIRKADWVVDLGPGAGSRGGEVVASCPPGDLHHYPLSLTGAYLSGKRRIPVPTRRRNPQGWITLTNVRTHNLKNIEVRFPRGCITVVTGLSGSGKSSLVMDTLYPALMNQIHKLNLPEGQYTSLTGTKGIEKVIEIDQSPIGRTPRSNPATYVELFGMIRKLFALTPEARARGYTPSRFSFNIRGGRCEACQGAGLTRVEMHFLPDLYVPCEVCQGKRFSRETLEISYKGKNITEVLELTVDEAIEFFASIPPLKDRLELLREVGLGYIRLGQPATTLSGGEAQRIKLARELSRRSKGSTVYILDEPTTGLHLEDVRRLIELLQRLVDKGNTIIVIEHHLDVIKCADWIVDLGPWGGDRGGELVATGTPEEIIRNPRSLTGQCLRQYLVDSGESGARILAVP